MSSSDADQPVLLTVRETARRLGVHENTVRNWVATGILGSVRAPGSRFHRFEPAEVDRVRLARLREPEPLGHDRRIIGPELIDATRLGTWADTRHAQEVFPRLIRRLLATTPGVEDLAGRAGEGVAYGGWDLEGTLRQATPWLPQGSLRFEVGVGRDPRMKAQADYEKRVADCRAAGTNTRRLWFIFATPRRWKGADAWARERTSEAVWAGVRVLDGDDFESWLDATPAVHYWISEQVGLRPRGVESAESWWDSFSARAHPALPGDLFVAGREPERGSLLEEVERGGGPIGVRAGWRNDALAFVCVALGANDDAIAPGRPALVVHEAEIWRRVVHEPGPAILIPLFAGRDSVATTPADKRVIVPFGSDEVQSGRAIVLPPPDRTKAAEVLREQGGVDFDEAERLAALSRRSMPALLRRRSANPAFATPVWATPPYGEVLAPLVLIGQWTDSPGDRALVADLVGRDWSSVERVLLTTANSDDRPFVRSGNLWRVASREEAFDVLAASLTSADLARWSTITANVLLEGDPLAGKDQTERLVASASGQGRTWSQTARAGLAEGLAMLGAHPEKRLAVHGVAADYAEVVVRSVLDRADADSTGAHWSALAYELPLIAEAAPRVFLDHVLDGTMGSRPLLQTMFQDGTDDGGWGTSSPHTGLLWALETLCWSPDFLVDATRALAQLATIDPGGRLGNRPISSLASVLVPWVRHTSASLEQRLAAITQIVREFGGVAWALVETLWPSMHATASPPASPRIRDWKPDHTNVPISEWLIVIQHIVGAAIELAQRDTGRWTELLTRLGPLPPDQRIRVVEEFELRIAELTVDPGAQLSVWEALTNEIEHHRSFPSSDWAMDTHTLDWLEGIARRIEPHGDVERFARLFDWRPEIGVVQFDDHERWRQELERLRFEAVDATFEAEGITGLARLARRAPVPSQLGWSMASFSLGDTHRAALLQWLTDEGATKEAAAAWVNRRAADQGPAWVAAALRDSPTDEARLIVARQARPEPGLWSLIENEWPQLIGGYWSSIDPWGVAREDVVPTAKQLLVHRRPRTAISVLAIGLRRDEPAADIPVDVVVETLRAALTTTEDAPARSNMLGYEIGQLLDFLEGASLPQDTLAAFEFAFFRALEHQRHPRALFAVLGADPSHFVDLVSKMYFPKSGPRRSSDESAGASAAHAWHVLHEWRTVPGLQSDGSISAEHLQRWVDGARLKLRDADRADVGDQQIGQVLAGSPPGADGAWPAEPVRDLVERLGSRELEHGLMLGKLNMRGVTSRSLYEGGAQERALATSFSEWSAATAGRWPRTSRLLEELARSYKRDAARYDAEAQQDADAD